MAMTPEEMDMMVKQLQSRLGGTNGQMALPGSTPGMQGFGDITKNPAANQAAQDLAGASSDTFAGALAMDNGTNLAARGGGRMSPFEAAANGMKTAVGMGMMAKNMKTKQNAIKSLLRSPDADSGVGGGDQYDPSMMAE